MENRGGLPPTILVIFGITGDLSNRYLLPALAQIVKDRQVGQKFRILGVSRRAAKPEEVFKQDQKILKRHAEIFQMDYSDPNDYKNLKKKLDEINRGYEEKSQVIFYFAVPPAAVLPIITNLGNSNLNHSGTKLLLEKPFGTDLKSAEELIREIDKHFPEERVYRIDHYLAKGMAQNIAVFLASNSVFRNVWNSQFIEKINIVAAEKIDIEGRVGFWESTGLLRDFVQSHLLQLAALTLMRPCAHMFDFAEMPERRLEALDTLRVADVNKVIRGQYRGYREEVKNPKSMSETFVAFELRSSDPRWVGAPINIFNGKSLDQKLTQIEIHFKKTEGAEPNLLTMRLHPREGIELDLWVKEPGYEPKLQIEPLRFLYEKRFGRVPDAYEQVLIDAIRSKRSLFASSQEVLTSWRMLQPILDFWKIDDQLIIYKSGSTLEEVITLEK